MGRYYQERDYPYFDYELGSSEEISGWELRGPIPDLDKPYFVCVGATQVFGRFCNRPFPRILSEELGLPVLNLGMGGHGPRTFLGKSLLSAINRAEFAIVQLSSARIGSNSFFENSESGRGDGIRLCDNKAMLFDEFLAEEFERSSLEVMARIVRETRDSWIASYRELLGAITVPTIIHWLSTVLPQRVDDYSSSVWELLGAFPQLVNDSMINQVRLFGHAYVETVSRKGLPQPLWKAGEEVSGTVLRNGMLFNDYYPSPDMHEIAAKDLLRPARALAASRAPKPSASDRETLVVSCSLEGGTVVSAWCGPKTRIVTYSQIEQDQDLLTFLLERRPFVIHVKPGDMLEAYLQFRLATSRMGNTVPPADVDLLELTNFARATFANEWRIAWLSRFQDLLEISIEKCRNNPAEALAEISKFMGLPLQWSSEMPLISPLPKHTVYNRVQLENMLRSLADSILALEA